MCQSVKYKYLCPCLHIHKSWSASRHQFQLPHIRHPFLSLSESPKELSMQNDRKKKTSSRGSFENLAAGCAGCPGSFPSVLPASGWSRGLSAGVTATRATCFASYIPSTQHTHSDALPSPSPNIITV